MTREDRMDELLLRHLRKQTTEEEDTAVDKWLGADDEGASSRPERQRTLAELGRVVEAGRIADRRIVPGAAPAAEDVIWRAEARQAGAAGPGVARFGRQLRVLRPRRGRFDLVAAAVVAVVGVGVWQVIAGLGRDSGPAGTTAATREFTTGPGETEMVRLGDGSVIRLGPDSRLATAWPTNFPEGAAREVTLDGEAFFAVTSDPARPFRVVTDAGTAQVLGTRFHLAVDAAELSVAVIEGRVALAGPDHEVQVGAGQATRLLRGLPEPVAAAAPTGSMADWLDGFLIFHDTPLGVAMEEVEARYGTDVVVSDDRLTNQTLTMWFDSKSLSEVMTVVCSVIDARCSIDAGVVRIESADRGAAS
ncbi:MAG: DUF4974 domain-containing protein [Gemmatimonadetes bacterium]|nr:DUF4974 domain-containing protein [Gemmatimonadota bacterium]MYE92738.1 DUF4974 domain-containing protein [Gemmatimonadota bacterium]MYJ08688.1 DUF4974 domain-containing protein [Gemmatimonadota bacterium]